MRLKPASPKSSPDGGLQRQSITIPTADGGSLKGVAYLVDGRSGKAQGRMGSSGLGNDGGATEKKQAAADALKATAGTQTDSPAADAKTPGSGCSMLAGSSFGVPLMDEMVRDAAWSLAGGRRQRRVAGVDAGRGVLLDSRCHTRSRAPRAVIFARATAAAAACRHAKMSWSLSTMLGRSRQSAQGSPVPSVSHCEFLLKSTHMHQFASKLVIHKTSTLFTSTCEHSQALTNIHK